MTRPDCACKAAARNGGCFEGPVGDDWWECKCPPSFKTKWKMFWLKRRARKLYLSMIAQLDSVTCGASLLRFLRPSFAREEDDFRKVWKEMQTLDRLCPPCPIGE